MPVLRQLLYFFIVKFYLD